MAKADKIEEARLRSAGKRMQVVVIILATVCLVGVVMFGLSLVDFAHHDSTSTFTDPKEEISAEEKEQARARFKENLQQYEIELEPRLQIGGLETWNRDGFFEITELKKEMLFFFSNGDYYKALESLQTLKNTTVEVLKEAEEIFQDNTEKASLALEKDLYDEAKLHIDRALIIDSQSSDALSLKEQIEKLPLILPLLDQAKIARAENNFQKEYDVLQQVVAISTERKKEKDRMKMLAELIDRQEFELHVSSGFKAAEENNVQEARYHYQQAGKIAPQRAELSLLATKISTLERSRRIQGYIKQAEQAIARDDWHEAREKFSMAVQEESENEKAAKGLQQAERVVRLLESLEQHIANPYRLVNITVRNDAEEVLAKAGNMASISFKVKRQADELKKLMAQTNRFIPVNIISDGKTYIQVRSVGKVGVVSEKIIQLKPGKYIFEGSRDGFKSKMVNAFIPYDLENFSVRIVCDEPI